MFITDFNQLVTLHAIILQIHIQSSIVNFVDQSEHVMDFIEKVDMDFIAFQIKIFMNNMGIFIKNTFIMNYAWKVLK